VATAAPGAGSSCVFADFNSSEYVPFCEPWPDPIPITQIAGAVVFGCIASYGVTRYLRRRETRRKNQ
jgi:hypothetical protein